MSKKNKATRSCSEDCFCIYLGPSKLGVIQYGACFGGSKETVLKQIAHITEKYPLVASLIVPGEELATARVLVKTPGNLLYVNYRKLAKM